MTTAKQTLGEAMTRRWMTILLIFVLLFFASSAYDFGKREYLSRQDPSRFFEYVNISYEGTNDEGIEFLSEAVWYRSGSVAWNDILRCDNGQGLDTADWPFWSSQTTDRFNTPSSDGMIRESHWVYAAGHPRDGRLCFLDSTTQMTYKGVDKLATFESSVFVPGSSGSR